MTAEGSVEIGCAGLCIPAFGGRGGDAAVRGPCVSGIDTPRGDSQYQNIGRGGGIVGVEVALSSALEYWRASGVGISRYSSVCTGYTSGHHDELTYDIN